MQYGLGPNFYNKSGTYKEDLSDPRKKILIADDEQLLCWSMTKHLNQGDEYTVACVPTAEEAYSFLDRFSFDLLILDYRLPGMSGLDLLSKLNEKRISLPVIMISASNDSNLEKKVLKKGAFLFLRKPFKLNDLKAYIRKFFAASSGREEGRKNFTQNEHRDVQKSKENNNQNQDI